MKYLDIKYLNLLEKIILDSEICYKYVQIVVNNFSPTTEIRQIWKNWENNSMINEGTLICEYLIDRRWISIYAIKPDITFDSPGYLFKFSVENIKEAIEKVGQVRKE